MSAETNLIPGEVERVDRKEETITNNPEHDLFFNAFTSDVFQARIQSGFGLFKGCLTESAFSIISNGQEIVYPALSFTRPDNLPSNFVAVRREQKISGKWFQEHENSLEEYFAIAHFHFHTQDVPFTNLDMRSYDSQEVFNNFLEKKRKEFGSLKRAIISIGIKETRGEVFKYQADMYFGVFIPQMRWVVLSQGQGWETYSLQLFMFSGPPTSDDYHRSNFETLSTAKQKEILEKSGMKVILVELPVENGKVELQPLKFALGGEFGL